MKTIILRTCMLIVSKVLTPLSMVLGAPRGGGNASVHGRGGI